MHWLNETTCADSDWLFFIRHPIKIPVVKWLCACVILSPPFFKYVIYGCTVRHFTLVNYIFFVKMMCIEDRYTVMKRRRKMPNHCYDQGTYFFLYFHYFNQGIYYSTVITLLILWTETLYLDRYSGTLIHDCRNRNKWKNQNN